ncbi:FAD-binding oxidoreductase [Flavobacterium humi]|uniref:FAD-binding oxidoreductase n=2 Tax=Flavobacterium humi TaxID=2562683 RepID=A0A4Z0LDG6_9FLAO|nr:FAD-binding oxidoreductase [Flavobacterium humi]
MNLQSGYPFWLIKDGMPFTFPKLAKNTTTDVVIIGAGISGALVRYYLLNAGIKCIMVDSRTIGLGSTCSSTSLLQYEIDTPLSELKKMIGEKGAERAFQLCNYAIEELGRIVKKIGFKDFEFKKSLYYAAYKKDILFLKEEYAARKKAGFDVRYLEEKDILKTFGFSSAGAILSNHGAQTNAYGLTHKLLQYKKDKKGALGVYDRTPVIRISHTAEGVVLETEQGYILKAKKLVYATGYESVDFIAEKIVDLKSTYAVISEQYETKTFWKDNVMLWNTADPYLYMRTTPDGRILIGGRDEDFYNPGRRDKLIGKKARQLSGDFRKLFPDISFKQEFSWTGTFGATKDGLPYIGEYSKLPNSYFALGFGGNGITFSLIAAEIITDMILGNENEDAALFSFERINK